MRKPFMSMEKIYQLIEDNGYRVEDKGSIRTDVFKKDYPDIKIGIYYTDKGLKILTGSRRNYRRIETIIEILKDEIYQRIKAQKNQYKKQVNGNRIKNILDVMKIDLSTYRNYYTPFSNNVKVVLDLKTIFPDEYDPKKYNDDELKITLSDNGEPKIELKTNNLNIFPKVVEFVNDIQEKWEVSNF